MVRAINPGTGTVSVLLVGRLILEVSFARAITNTRPKLTTAAQRTEDILFMMAALKSDGPKKAFRPRWIRLHWLS